MRHRILLLLLSASLLQGAGTSSEAVFAKAAQALAAGDLEAAARGFRQVLKAQPNHVGALGNLGVVYSRMERTAEAIDLYRRALRLSPNEPGLWLNLGLAQLKLEDYAAAKPWFARVNRSSLASDQSKELLATCQIYTGETSAALASLEALPRSSGVLFLLAVGYLKAKQRDKAQAVLAELLTSGTSPAQAQFLLGKAYAENALFDEAIAAFIKAAELEPKLPAVHLELGKAYLGTRYDPAAERELRAALIQNPNDPEPSYYLGALLVRLARETEAIPLLDHARSARPNGWGAYYYLGRAHLQLGHATLAVPLLENAVRLNPDEGAIYYQLARAYQSSGRPVDAQRSRARLTELRHRAGEDERIFANR